LHLTPALAPLFNVPRRDGVRRLGYFAFRVRRLCCPVLPRNKLLVQLVGFFFHHPWHFSPRIHYPAVIRTHTQASRSTVRSRPSETLSATHHTRYVHFSSRSQGLRLTHVQGSTVTGGPNWIDAETTVYNKSLILTYNLAYSGATIDANLVTPYTPTVKSLTDQVNQFLASYADKPASVPWKSKHTLFSVWIGINDIGNSWSLGGDRQS